MPRLTESDKFHECWNYLISQLSNSGKELRTWSASRPREIRFKARARGNVIVVESPSLSYSRKITFKEFECVCKLYNDYISGVTRVRQRIRDRCGLNSSYIITLIHEFC